MKIPFDIKYRPQIESGEYAVFTDCGEPVEIVKWDCKGNCPILAVIDDGDTHDCCFFKRDGLSFSEKESLNIVTPEPEYTEFEKKVAEILFDRQDEDDWVMCLKLGKEYAKELLNIAKREFNETSCSGESRIMTREMIDGRLLQNDTKSWNEDYNEEDLQTRFAFYTYKDDPSVLYLSNLFVEEASRNRGLGSKILKAAEKVAETIGVTTICLKVKQDSPAAIWYLKNGYRYVAFSGEYDWLAKTLKSI